jgi:hypothetical protein
MKRKTKTKRWLNCEDNKSFWTRKFAIYSILLTERRLKYRVSAV